MAESVALKGIVRASREAIKVGSLSFSLAASLLSRRARHSVFMLYAWCRHADDRIDRLPQNLTLEAKLQVCDQLVTDTRSAMITATAKDNVFVGFGYVARHHEIPEYYPLQLLEGMRMDLTGTRYESMDDLLLYCYRVAGVVGLMATHILGANSEKAVVRAVHMGMAMQLTNIARDVFEDHDMERVYLPGALLEKYRVDAKRLKEPSQRAGLVAAVQDLLCTADKLYASGDEGLRYLPARMAFAVASARYIYADIGRRVRRRGSAAWDTRTYVPFGRKLYLLSKAFRATIATIPYRFGKRPTKLPLLTWQDAVSSAAKLTSD